MLDYVWNIEECCNFEIERIFGLWGLAHRIGPPALGCRAMSSSWCCHSSVDLQWISSMLDFQNDLWFLDVFGGLLFTCCLLFLRTHIAASPSSLASHLAGDRQVSGELPSSMKRICRTGAGWDDIATILDRIEDLQVWNVIPCLHGHISGEDPWKATKS